MKNVRFVVDDREPSEYVKAIIKDHPGLVPEEKVLDSQHQIDHFIDMLKCHYVKIILDVQSTF